MKSIFFILSISFVLYSCSGSNNQIFIDDENVIIVPINMEDIPSINKLMDMDENSLLSFSGKYFIDITQLVDSVRYVKLETNNECLIGGIRKVFFAKNRFFIHETKTSTILVFNELGKFLYKVGRRGRGPGEYVRISCLLLDETREMLMLYDVSSRKMIYYSLDGKFINEITNFSSGFVIRDIINLPSGKFICYKPDYTGGDYPCGVWEVDSVGKIGTFFIQQNTKYPIVFTSESNFYELPEGRVGLWCVITNDIYHFSDTSGYKYMSLKPNKKTVNDFPNVEYNTNIQMIVNCKVIEKGNYLIIEWRYTSNLFYFTTVYFKKENKSFTGIGINYGMNSIDAIQGSNVDFNIRDQMMQVIYAHDFFHLKENNYVSAESKKMLSSFFSEDFEENPVLEILYVKK